MIDKCVIENGIAKCVCKTGKKGAACNQDSCEGYDCGANSIYLSS